MKKILYVAHHFPPLGGAGVQRSVKFVKYLPGYGVLPVVVTGPGVSESKWEVEDETMVGEVPSEVPVFRSSGREDGGEESGAGKIVGWRERGLVDAGIRASKEHQVEAIVVSMSPFGNCEVGRALSERLGVPWIADLRDPWALDEFQVYRSFVHRRKALSVMRKSLATASGIIMNTPFALQRLLTAFPEFRDRPVTAITNGFDAADFADGEDRQENSRFKIVHTGTFHAKMGRHQCDNSLMYRLLGRCKQGVRILPRTPFYLLQALRSLQEEDSVMFERIDVVFAGVMSAADTRMIEESGLADRITVTGYVAHSESIAHLHSADLLFLPLHAVGETDNSSIVPGKTYEYIASGSPILGALPAGDARDFVEAAGNCRVVDPEDVDGLAKGIRHFFQLWQEGGIAYRRDAASIQQFDRRELTADLAKFLEETIEGAPSRGAIENRT